MLPTCLISIDANVNKPEAYSTEFANSIRNVPSIGLWYTDQLHAHLVKERPRVYIYNRLFQ